MFCLLSAIDLINNLLQVKMRKRFSVDKSLSHPWLQVNPSAYFTALWWMDRYILKNNSFRGLLKLLELYQNLLTRIYGGLRYVCFQLCVSCALGFCLSVDGCFSQGKFCLTVFQFLLCVWHQHRTILAPLLNAGSDECHWSQQRETLLSAEADTEGGMCCNL